MEHIVNHMGVHPDAQDLRKLNRIGKPEDILSPRTGSHSRTDALLRRHPSVTIKTDDPLPSREIPAASVPATSSAAPVETGNAPCRKEIEARKVIARHRQRLDWVLHVPEFDALFKDGLQALGLPVPRRGIGLRALVDSLMLEAKKDLLLWTVSNYNALLPGPTAVRIAQIWDINSLGLNWADSDHPLSTPRWLEFKDDFVLAIHRQHRRYKDSQQILYYLHRDLPEKLSQRMVYDPAKRADARQEGTLGLLHAIDKTDTSDTPFSSYAQQWVSRAIRNYLLGERFPVHVPVNLASSILSQSSRSTPATAESPAPPVHPESDLLKPRLCLDAPVSGDARPPAITDESTPNPGDLLNRQEILGIVQDMINQLSDKQRDVLMRRFGLGAGHEAETLVHIAQSIGISHQQVSMREKRALDKLGSILKPVYREMYG